MPPGGATIPQDSGRDIAYCRAARRVRAIHGRRPARLYRELQHLGTRFTVRAYRDEARVQVFVAAGKVALRAVGSPESSGTVLGPRDLGVLDSIGRTTVRNGVDSTSHLAWTRDRFVFNNAPLADVLPEIARWFDVNIDVADNELLKRRVTLNVPARSLADVLAAVTTPLRLRSAKRGSQFVIE